MSLIWVIPTIFGNVQFQSVNDSFCTFCSLYYCQATHKIVYVTPSSVTHNISERSVQVRQLVFQYIQDYMVVTHKQLYVTPSKKALHFFLSYMNCGFYYFTDGTTEVKVTSIVTHNMALPTSWTSWFVCWNTPLYRPPNSFFSLEPFEFLVRILYIWT